MSREDRGEIHDRSADRAQSPFDFSLGVSFFIIVIIGVLVFIPTAFASFNPETTGGTGDELAAKRGADYLTGSALAATDSPVALDPGCTFLFFEGTTAHSDIGASPGACGLEPGATVASNLSLGPHQFAVNVTVEKNLTSAPGLERLCWDSDENRLRPTGSCGGSADFNLTAGSSAARNEHYAVARQYARLNGRGVFVVVRTW